MANNLYNYNAILHGGILDNNTVPTNSGTPVIRLNGQHKNGSTSFSLNTDILSKHMLFVGGTGTGKTNLFKHCVKQIKHNMSADDVMVIFDTKGDFCSLFHEPVKDSIIGNSKEYRDRSEKWNIFREICIDGYNDEDIIINAQEICRTLFSDRTDKNSSNLFFPNAARDLFASILITLVRKKHRGDFKADLFKNDTLKNIMDSFSADELIDLLCEYTDLISKTQYINGKNGQSQGVLSEMYSVINDLFIGVFNDNGAFSVRNFVRNKGGKTLFIEYDMAIGDSLSPIYTLLFDLALKETLSRNSSTNRGNVYLILDELKLLPNLKHLDDGINFGRSLGLKIIAGLQSVDQLNSVYDSNEAVAQNIIAGFSSVVSFRLNDFKTREHISKLYGKNIVVEQYQGLDGLLKESRRDGNVVEDWDLAKLQVGEAVVGLPDTPPFKFHFELYK
jgi:type IV secretory pathway TraG/TraD family ATPase VirD4